MRSPLVILRADAGVAIGHGHVMRSLTLGRALASRGVDVCLVSKLLPTPLSERATRAGISVDDLGEEPYGLADARHVASLSPRIVVVDGYLFGPDFFRFLSTRELSQVLIDDNEEVSHQFARLIVNQNPHAEQVEYARRPECATVLRGLQFALVRPEVLRARLGPDFDRHGLVVSVGGSDTAGLVAAIEGHIESQFRLSVLRPERVGGVAEIAAVLASAEIAVVGAGTTLWESLYLGVPVVALVVADNQVRGANALGEAGLIDVVDLRSGLDLGAVSDAVAVLRDDPQERRRRTAAGQQAIDGLGADRVADRIVALLGEP